LEGSEGTKIQRVEEGGFVKRFDSEYNNGGWRIKEWRIDKLRMANLLAAYLFDGSQLSS
jgi:hypothetical protein